MKHIYTILTIMLSVCITACKDDLSELGTKNGNALVLMVGGGNDYIVTRSEDAPEFQEGTLFHLYGTTTADNNETWATNYLNNGGTGAQITNASASDATIGNARRLEGNGLAKEFFAKPLNLYGVTVVGVMADQTPDTAEEIENNNDLLDSYLSGTKLNGVPQYNVTYTKENESDPSYQALPDIMWSGSMKGLTPKTHAGNVVMPYVHTLSKLNFYATLAPDLDATYTNMKVTGMAITDYAVGTLNMADGMYTRDDTATRYIISDAVYLKEDVTLQTEKAQHFATTLAFPTEKADYAIKTGELEMEPITALLTVAYGTGFSQSKTFEVPLMYGKDVNNQDSAQVFKPNHEYDITFSITTSGVIVTLVPTFYEVGEKIDLFDFEMGEPIDFGGVLWAAQNLGATSSDPTENAISWEMARGFYYQMGRSIPYFVRGSQEDPYPNVSVYDKNGFTYNSNNAASWWDGEQGQVLYTAAGLAHYGLSENVRVPYGKVMLNNDKTHGSRMYPYIPVLWETVLKNGGKFEDYLAKTRYYRNTNNGQTEPSKTVSDPYYAKDYIKNYTSSTKLNDFASTSYDSGNRWHKTDASASGNWTNDPGYSSPAPKGWRLPTLDDILSIMPASDSRFCDPAFTHKLEANNHTLSKTNRQYRYVSKNEGVEDYKGENSIYLGIYQDGSGYNDLGTTTVVNANGTKNYKEGWGSVFCIKRYQTKNAYLLRWQIEIADHEEVKNGWVYPSRYEVDAATQAYIGRGVLVVSKYELNNENKDQICIVAEEVPGVNVGSKEALHLCRVFVDSDNDQTKDEREETINIDWSRPSGQLKLPVSGYMYNSGGQALFFPGSEGIYWTSSRNGNRGISVRIKFSGDYETRWIQIYDIELPVHGCQIRCVRDTDASY